MADQPAAWRGPIRQAHGRSDRSSARDAKDGTEIYIDDSGAPIKDERGETIGVILVFRDITARRAAEREQERLREEQLRMEREQATLQTDRLRLQDELVAAQHARLAELSTPLIPLTNRIVLMPLIGTIDSERAAQILDALSNGVVAGGRNQTSERDGRGAEIAIVDITGVRQVDSHVAGALVQAAQAVRLLGAEAIITGIRPQVAHTLVGLGVDFAGLTTRSTLERGLRHAMERLNAADKA